MSIEALGTVWSLIKQLAPQMTFSPAGKVLGCYWPTSLSAQVFSPAAPTTTAVTDWAHYWPMMMDVSSSAVKTIDRLFLEGQRQSALLLPFDAAAVPLIPAAMAMPPKERWFPTAGHLMVVVDHLKFVVTSIRIADSNVCLARRHSHGHQTVRNCGVKWPSPPQMWSVLSGGQTVLPALIHCRCVSILVCFLCAYQFKCRINLSNI